MEIPGLEEEQELENLRAAMAELYQVMKRSNMTLGQCSKCSAVVIHLTGATPICLPCFYRLGDPVTAPAERRTC